MSLVEKFTNNLDNLGNTLFEEIRPEWWNDAHSGIVLRQFKLPNGKDSGASIGTVKSAIKNSFLNKNPEPKQGSGEPEQRSPVPFIDPTEYLIRSFDALHFHTIIKESGVLYGYQDENLILKKFEAVTRNDNNLLCGWAMVEQVNEEYRPHYVLKLKEDSKYRCISCGETENIFRYETMPVQYMEEFEDEQEAKKGRDKLIHGTIAATPGSVSREIMKGRMLKAGVWEASDPPVGTAL